jgi:hypothetical protein
MWIREMLKADSISTARFMFELCGGRVALLLLAAWLTVELADSPVVSAPGAEKVLQSFERKGKRV